ncbi:MAG: T9SS type A sorting domain-containing protein [Bacteroidia bacterium]|nr:T9SS type A sorting domain-containing protein [Bacteroidia bacterium]
MFNYWFYLFVKGGSGTNTTPDLPGPGGPSYLYIHDYCVNGIGWDKVDEAAYIVFHALLDYLPSGWGSWAAIHNIFNGMRLSTSEVAKGYGLYSEEKVQAQLAWDAVGVYSDIASSPDESSPYSTEYPISFFNYPNYWYNQRCPDESTEPNGTVINARATITAPGSGCNTVNIDFGAEGTEYIAGDRIYLKPGFNAPYGCKFHAWIKPCQNGAKIIRSGAENKTTSSLSLIENKPLPQEQATELFVSPNPTNDKVKISFNNPLNTACQIQLIDISSGKVLLSDINTEQYFTINLSQFSPSVYTFRAITDKKTFTRKIVKQ